jgi:hypothetical protein
MQTTAKEGKQFLKKTKKAAAAKVAEESNDKEAEKPAEGATA